MLLKEKKHSIVNLAKNAGSEIMQFYKHNFDVYTKGDSSPLTQADMKSHDVILEGLNKLTPDLPVLSEESDAVELKNRMTWESYWLVDPLDGTKEFVKKNDEFTVNIALIYRNRPVFGVVHAPALGVTYWGGGEVGAFRSNNECEDMPIHVRDQPKNSSEVIIVGSRSHMSKEFESFVTRYPGAQIVSMGSSLKFCLIAEGAADLYPRLGLTSEWDTAAAQAVIEGAGGKVVSLPDLVPLSYNVHPDTLLNPHFLVCSK